MLEFGRMNRLEVSAIDGDGAWLTTGQEEALLRVSEVPGDMATGDKVNVFVYADMDGHAVATLKQPLAEVGEFAMMKAGQVNAHGAFMDWGLSKDLLVPPKEQPEPMKPG